MEKSNFKELILDTSIKQTQTKYAVAQPEIKHNFSVYVNGQHIETSVYCSYYQEDELMLPAGSILMILGFNVEYNHKDNYTKVYKNSYFDSDAILIRYSFDQNNDILFYYYSKGADYLPINTPPQVIANELYLPISFFVKALGCSISVSNNGNIAINSAE
ncbi:MAG TPA: hypothetical protein VIL24_05410 [Clostridia bacterium]